MELLEAHEKEGPRLNQNSKHKKSTSEDKRLEWLRSQIIGSDVEVETPFGKRMLTYADHTASGRCLFYIEDYIVEHVLPSYGNTHTTDSFVGSKTTKLVNEATDYIKRCMGAGPDDALLFCGSGTTSSIKRLQEVMGIAVPSIMKQRLVKTLSNEERWVVFVGPHEHHSNLLSWRQSTAEVVEISIDDKGLIDMEALRVELESEKYTNRPKLGSFSACSNVTGILSDTRSLARLLHSHGAFACFDFATSAPYVKIDMKSGDIDGYDAVFLSPHKFVGGPGSPGILMMNKALYQLRSSPPSTSGGGTVCYVNAFSEEDTLYYDDIEEREDAGTPPIIQKIRAALALWVKEYIGYSIIDRYERVYTEIALKAFLANPNICVFGNSRVDRLPILSFLVFPPGYVNCEPMTSNVEVAREAERSSGGYFGSWKKRGKPLNGRFVAKLLNDLFGIQARGGCTCAGPYGHHLLGVDDTLSRSIRSLIEKGYQGLKPGWTRISIPYYMCKEELAFIVASIEFIASYGHRFLPLYHFDWRSGDWTFKEHGFKHHLMEQDLTLVSSSFFSKCRNGVKKVIRREGNRKDSKIGSRSNHFASYLESAHRVADSLPDDLHQMITTVPEEIDQSMILFRL